MPERPARKSASANVRLFSIHDPKVLSRSLIRTAQRAADWTTLLFNLLPGGRSSQCRQGFSAADGLSAGRQRRSRNSCPLLRLDSSNIHFERFFNNSLQKCQHMLSIPKSYWQLLCAVCSNPDRASHHFPLIAAFPHEFMARLVRNLPRTGDKASRLQSYDLFPPF